MFRFLPKSRSSRTLSTRRRRLNLETLESRTLMAADLTASLNFDTRILSVEGTPNNDAIVVLNVAGQVSVAGIPIKFVSGGTIVGATSSIHHSMVQRVEINALEGHDVVRMNEVYLSPWQCLPLTIRGGDGDDTITGGSMADLIFGGNGNDVIMGMGNDDSLYGDNGNDNLICDAGSDRAFGGYGNDTMSGGAGNDELDGGGDDDSLYITAPDRDRLFGGSGRDKLIASVTLATLSDSSFTFWDRSAGWISSAIGGFEVADLTAIDAGLGYTQINAFAFNGSTRMYGSAITDYLTGGAGPDLIYGNGGNDLLLGNSGHDQLFGGHGSDTLQGGDGDDRLDGSDGNDQLFGGIGDDYLKGGYGSDELHGGAGNDILDAVDGWYSDYLYGDEGADLILFDSVGSWITSEDSAQSDPFDFRHGVRSY